jgi:hypothetical protein
MVEYWGLREPHPLKHIAMVEALSGAFSDNTEGIGWNRDLQLKLLGESLSKSSYQGAAAGERETTMDNIAG